MSCCTIHRLPCRPVYPTILKVSFICLPVLLSLARLAGMLGFSPQKKKNEEKQLPPEQVVRQQDWPTCKVSSAFCVLLLLHDAQGTAAHHDCWGVPEPLVPRGGDLQQASRGDRAATHALDSRASSAASMMSLPGLSPPWALNRRWYDNSLMCSGTCLLQQHVKTSAFEKSQNKNTCASD